MGFPLILLFMAILASLFGLIYYQVVKPAQDQSSPLESSGSTVTVPATSSTAMKSLLDKASGFFQSVSSGEIFVDDSSRSIDWTSFKQAAHSFSDIYFPIITSNRVFSPIAMASILSIVYEASGKEGRSQIEKLLGSVYNIEQLAQMGQIYNQNLSYPGLMTSYFSINSQIPIEDAFVKQMKGICMISSDNYTESIAIMSEINRLFSARTEGLLTNAAKLIKPESKSIFFNTFYWKNEWAIPFDPRKSTAMNFTQATGNRRIYRAMKNSIKIPYFANDLMQLIEMDFKTKDYSMGFLLPKPSKNGKAVQVTFNSSLLLSYISQLKTEYVVRVILPKFRLKRMLRMQGWLRSLGIKDIFDAKKATFPSLAPKGGLVLTDIIHEGILGIDEFGSNSLKAWWKQYQQQQQSLGKARRNETVSLKPEKEFLANRNFLFYLRHKPSNLLLFVGDYDG